MASFSFFDKEEIARIFETNQSNDRIEGLLNKKIQDWKSEIDPLTKSMNINFNAENAKIIMEVQATALSLRLRLIDEMAIYAQLRLKEGVKYKKLYHEKMVWYSLGGLPGSCPVNVREKMNAGQITKLIDAHVSEAERAMELIEIHIESLKAFAKALSDIGYNIKNMIEYNNFLVKI